MIRLLPHRLVPPSQLTAVADWIQALVQSKTRARWWPAVCLGACHFSAIGGDDARPQRLVTAVLKSALSSLSIPHSELDQLAGSQLSDAALTAWALTKTMTHPAVEEAAGVSGQLLQLLNQLDGAMLWQQKAAASPLGRLLWQVAVVESCRGARTVNIQNTLPHLALCPLITRGCVDASAQKLHQPTETRITAALNHPAFWGLAQAAAAQQQTLLQDLQLLGYDLTAVGSWGNRQLQQLQQLTGVQAAKLQQQVVQELQADASILLPWYEKQLQDAVANSSTAYQWLAQLQVLQLLAAALGFSGVQVAGSASAPELVRRLTGASIPHQAVDDEVLHQVAAAAPQLLAAVTQEQHWKALEQPSVGTLLQLMESRPDLQGVARSLTSWRAAAAAAGHVPVLITLSHTEVAGLSGQQASAVVQAIMQLEAQARLLMRKAVAGQLSLDTLSGGDAAALAWKVHTGGQAAVEELVSLVLAQAADVYSAAMAKLDSAAAALSNMAAAFHLEEFASRRSNAAPPSQLVLAGAPQDQVTELAKSFPVLTGSNRSSSHKPAHSTAEGLVRALADLLAGSWTSSASQQSAAQRLQVIAHDLPRVMSGALLDLLAVHNTAGTAGTDSARQHQQRLHALMAVLEAELPRLAAADSAHGSGNWLDASSGDSGSSAGEGVLELLGEQDSRELLLYSSQRAQAGQMQQQGLYEQLGDIHHDIDIQRYLQIEFDPALDVDAVNAPRGWQDTELWLEPAEFLDAMKPLLNKYMEAQGEAAVNTLEWQVYRDAALIEHNQFEVSTAAGRAAAGHSPFNNSRADEAYLVHRLETSIPQDSVLYAAAHKYLKASFQNRTWRFGQRKHMVDRLVEIAALVAAHPPLTHRGSPFSPLFQPNGPPVVPRLARKLALGRAARSKYNWRDVGALPDGFRPPAVR